MSEVAPEARGDTASRAVGLYEVGIRLAWAPIIAAAYLPVHAAVPIARALAGKHTSLTMGITLTVSISIVLGGSTLLALKVRSQRRVIRRQRERISQLESQIAG